MAANKITGVRAALCHDDFSARQGVEDDKMNVLCFGGRTTGIAVAWDCTKNFLGAKIQRCRPPSSPGLAKVTQLESSRIVSADNNKEFQAVGPESLGENNDAIRISEEIHDRGSGYG